MNFYENLQNIACLVISGENFLTSRLGSHNTKLAILWKKSKITSFIIKVSDVVLVLQHCHNTEKSRCVYLFSIPSCCRMFCGFYKKYLTLPFCDSTMSTIQCPSKLELFIHDHFSYQNGSFT